jgi:hypothetical protein
MVTIRVLYTPQDFVAANWIHWRPRAVLGWLGILIASLFAVALVDSFFLHSEPAGWLDWAALGVPAYFAYFFGVHLPYKCRKAYRQRKDLQRECEFVADGSTLKLETLGGSMNKPWSDYLKWKEGKAAFLVYMSDNVYHLLPKRCFESEADIGKFRELLVARVVGGRSDS